MLNDIGILTNYTGMLFSRKGDISHKEFLERIVIESHIDNPVRIENRGIRDCAFRIEDSFFVIRMPCGEQYIIKTYNDFVNLPEEDIPCRCGNPNHWFIRFENWE